MSARAVWLKYALLLGVHVLLVSARQVCVVMQSNVVCVVADIKALCVHQDVHVLLVSVCHGCAW